MIRGGGVLTRRLGGEQHVQLGQHRPNQLLRDRTARGRTSVHVHVVHLTENPARQPHSTVRARSSTKGQPSEIGLTPTSCFPVPKKKYCKTCGYLRKTQTRQGLHRVGTVFVPDFQLPISIPLFSLFHTFLVLFVCVYKLVVSAFIVRKKNWT